MNLSELNSPLWGGLILIATAVSLVTLAALHVLPTQLSPLSAPVSQYGISRYRLGYRVLTVSMGIAALAAAAGVAATFPNSGRAESVALLAVFGVCRLVISWFPMDAPGTRPPTSTGLIHVLLALVTFVTAALAGARMYRAVHRLGGFSGYDTTLQIAVWLMAIGIATYLTGYWMFEEMIAHFRK